MLLNQAIKAALAAGKEILRIYEDADTDVEYKADNSPLTAADKASHDVIIRYLESSALPVLSEEGKDIPYSERQQWKNFWLVDPLDGTKEFIKRNGEFTVNIALVQGGIPIMGVVYAPVLREIYFADTQKGAFKYSIPAEQDTDDVLANIYVNATKLPMNIELENYTVVASRSHNNEDTQRYIQSLEEKYGAVSLVSKGSSLKICLVAEGIANEYPRLGPTMEWDTAAGQAIAQIAGKQVMEFGANTPLRYNKQNLLNNFFVVK